MDWLLAFLIAAVFHEVCHILTVYALHGSVIRMTVKPAGCVLETTRMAQGHQFLSILAGPMGSLSLLLLCRIMPKIAVCGLFHGLYNLLPIMPLDGGRMLRLILNQFLPKQADRIMKMVLWGSCILFDCLALWFCIAASVGPMVCFSVLLWNLKLLSGNITCKAPEIKVQ